MAIVRTVSSPRCCATSRTSMRPALSTCRAFRMNGRSPSNLTSTTAPMTWVIVPMLFFAMTGVPCVLGAGPLEGFGAGNNLDQFLGDDRLAGAVVVDGQPVDPLAGIARRAVHRRHARALLARHVLVQRRDDLHRKIVLQERLQDLVLVPLELIIAGDPGS